MKYTLLRQDMNPGAWTAVASDKIDFPSFLAARKLGALPDPALIELTEDSEVQSDLLEFPYFIVSGKMRNALNSFGITNIEYSPATLYKALTGEKHHDYWLANIIGLISCVDESKSQYKTLRTGGKILRSFAVNEDATKGEHIFRLQESKSLVLISDKLKTHLEKNGLVGINFQPTQKFNGEPASSFWDDDE